MDSGSQTLAATAAGTCTAACDLLTGSAPTSAGLGILIGLLVRYGPALVSAITDAIRNGKDKAKDRKDRKDRKAAHDKRRKALESKDKDSA